MLEFTQWLAIYGAILATFNVLWTISRARPKIRIEVVPGHQLVGEDFELGFWVAIQNHSSQPAHILSIEALLPAQRLQLTSYLKQVMLRRRLVGLWLWAQTNFPFHSMATGLPKTLEPGQSLRLFLSDTAFGNNLRHLKKHSFKITVQDQLWRRYNSEEIRFHLSVAPKLETETPL